MKPEVASRRIESFGQRFGEAHLYLAYHAAFPLALTPDLLYRLWANFQRDIHKQELKIPWLAVADLLLSSLCDEVGHELYEMDTAVRNALLKKLKENPRFGEKRINELSDFLLTYVQQQLESHDPDIRDFAQAQKWTALAYTRPSEAARELALTLSKLKLEEKAEWVRMASLIDTFAEPLAEFAPLMTYTRGMASLTRGNQTKALAELNEVTRQQDKVEIAGVNLSIPTSLIRQIETDPKPAKSVGNRTKNSSAIRKKILVLSANPTTTNLLRLSEQARKIQIGLERYQNREQFEIIPVRAVRPDDLRRVLLDYEPEIVHFSGYGRENEGLAWENNSGQMQLVSSESLARLFRLFKNKIECVFLNACYSETQALAIHQYINYVVGMNWAIGDRAAIEFAVGFYDALSAGRSYEDAYEFGCSAINIEGIPEYSMPVLKSRKNSLQDSQTIPTVPAFLENPQGEVPLNSPFYVERPPIEVDCYETILKPGALIRIKAPQQMGQISLMKRILSHAHQHGYQIASFNFQLVDAECFTSLDQFLQWFCASITYELNLPDKVDDYWKGVLSSRNKCANYFQRYLLPAIKTPIALGLYEVDEVFRHPIIAGDFLGLLRAWHERSKNEDIWKNLRLIIVHSAEVYIPLNINQSPFNVGLPIELPCFNQMQVQDLVERHGLNWSNLQVKELMALVDGHPYLVRVALYEIARGKITLSRLQQIAATDEGPYGDHLRRHWLNLQTDVELLDAIKQVVIADSPVGVGAEEAFKLRSMGLVKFQDNKVMPLCNLYRQYFLERLKIKF